MVKPVTTIAKNGQLKSDTKKSGIITNILNGFFKIIQFILQNPAKVITLGLAGQVVANSTHILAATPKNVSFADHEHALNDSLLFTVQKTVFTPVTGNQSEKFNKAQNKPIRTRRSYHATENSRLLYSAAREGNLCIVQQLKAQGMNITNWRNRWDNTPLHVAVRYGHLPLVQYFIEQGANINSKNIFGMTPLHRATLDGRFTIVRYLVEHGADIHAIDSNNWTPLRYAADGEFLSIVEYLESHSTDHQNIIKNFTNPSLFFSEAAATPSIPAQTLNASLIA